MDSIDLSQLSNAVNGFLSSLGQTGSDVGGSLVNLGNSIASKVPSSISSAFKVRDDPPPPPPSGISAFFSNLFCERKRVVAVLVASIATTGGIWYLVQTRQRASNRNRPRHDKYRRRLARRASNGGRSELVLIVGSPNEPLVRLIARDLNIRGFIVYVTATPSEEESIQKENCEDIRPVKLTSYFEPSAISSAMEYINKILETPVTSFDGAVPHFYSLAGIILVPDLFYPSGPLETIPPAQWAQTVQSKIQMPLNVLSTGGLDLARKHSSRILLLTPVIIGSLAPAFHAAEAMVYGALSSLALSLSRELALQHVPFIHMKLGSFDTRQLKAPSSSVADSPPLSYGQPNSDRQVRSRIHADILSWPDSMRRLYGGHYKASAFLFSNQSRGTNLRMLYHSIYDALTSPSPPRVIRAGRGSSIYDLLTSWAPESLISLLLRSNERS